VLCDECRQRPAVVHITKIINNVHSEIHLCEQCAQGREEFAEASFGFPKLIASLFDWSSVPGVRRETKCTSCGLTQQDFRRLGQLGCPSCYEGFAPQLEPLLRRLHGGARHRGKVPGPEGKGIKIRRELEGLRRQLQEAISKEEYELAAKLRDEIRNLEGQLG
jgi:protein arginine kinase activator